MPQKKEFRIQAISLVGMSPCDFAPCLFTYKMLTYISAKKGQIQRTLIFREALVSQLEYGIAS
jgi:hypothetical protein